MLEKEGVKEQGSSASDRRSTARFSMLEYALIKGIQDDAQVRSVIIDVSLGGLQVRSREKFLDGGKVTLAIGRLEASPLSVSAVVKYSRPLPDTDLFSTGLSVVPTSPEERIHWADYVHAIFQLRAEELI
jgi:hypothetical protein